MTKGHEHALETFAAAEVLRKLPKIDAERIVLAGQSAGGFSSVAAGSTQPTPSWLKAVINYSGGRTNATTTHTALGVSLYNPSMVEAFKLAGSTSQAPHLWIFAENDSRYSTETIRDSHKVFVEAGGKAELRLFPPSKGDGHFVYHEPDKWRADLRRFLEGVGLVTAQAVKTPPVAQAPNTK